MSGRFAPSPTGDLHVGNLRTAVASWADARQRGVEWLVRFEDLDGVVADRETADRQLESLALLGLEPDLPPLWQSDHLDRYDDAIQRLVVSDLTYPCFCSRREVREAIAAAASAPNGPTESAYPGTCSTLSGSERDERASQRPPALRFRADSVRASFVDENAGPQSLVVGDVVFRRNDGVPAYNLVVVVDDAAQGITSVVRADDLLSSTARQILIAQALGLPSFDYAHVPLVVNPVGERLTKRDGAMTLPELAPLGWSAADVLSWICDSMGVDRRDPAGSWPQRLPAGEWRNTWQSPVEPMYR